MKKTVSLLLSLLMVLTVLPLTDVSGLFTVEASAEETVTFENIDMISFGSYPQSEVTDETTKAALTTAAGDTVGWTSYNYYISGSQSDYMKYTDVEYNGEKYRGVYFTSYRPYNTTTSSSTNYSYQDDNGYSTNTIYWFKYEPVTWTVLDEETGLVVSNVVLDSQQYYNSTSSRTIDGNTVYANNYQYSDIRTWLNDNFLNTAFTADEQKLISTTTLDNSAYSTSYSQYDSNSTKDKIFALSYSEANKYWNSSSDRRTGNTAYAKCQGVYNYTDYGTSIWWLRSAGYDYSRACFVDYDGGVDDDYCYVYRTFNGIRPALCLNLSSLISESEITVW